MGKSAVNSINTAWFGFERYHVGRRAVDVGFRSFPRQPSLESFASLELFALVRLLLGFVFLLSAL